MFSRNGNGNHGGKDHGGRPKRSQTGLSFIGPEVVVAGSLTTSAQVQVDGRIDGDLNCETLSMGESGVIAGDIRAEEARIAGLVEGKVSARVVTVEATGRITGDVSYDTISIAAGAQIEGRFARRAALGEVDSPLLVATPIEARAKDGSDEGGRTGKDLFPLGEAKRAVGR